MMPIALADLPLYSTPRQVAEVFGFTEQQVRGLVRSGRLDHKLVGTRVHIPKWAIEAFYAETEQKVQPCRDETQARTFNGTATGIAGTSPTPKAVAAGSAARALQIAQSLKSPSQSSSTPALETPGRVIPLRSS
jgi:hypothetical protein